MGGGDDAIDSQSIQIFQHRCGVGAVIFLVPAAHMVRADVGMGIDYPAGKGLAGKGFFSNGHFVIPSQFL